MSQYISVRVRTKDCYVCKDAKEVLYRCQYQDLEDWVFLCGKCLTEVKTRFEATYQYGGTWKSKKKQAHLQTENVFIGYKANKDNSIKVEGLSKEYD